MMRLLCAFVAVAACSMFATVGFVLARSSDAFTAVGPFGLAAIMLCAAVSLFAEDIA